MMDNKILQRAAEYLKVHGRKKKWRNIVTCLAAVVVFCTVYALILPAITMENTAYCGKEEHKHTDECYKKELICGQEETEAAVQVYTSESDALQSETVGGQEEASPVQVNTGNDAAAPQRLICENMDPEHQHTEECYETPESSDDGKEEYVHTEECYTAGTELQCGFGDAEEIQEHKHTKECYKSVLICEKEEHTHELGCYSNPKADVETEEDWTDSVSGVELTGNWRNDLMAVAESQLGYTESSENYKADEENEEEKKGYTRYGEWYGDPYGDWDAMFVSFCLNYAKVKDFPQEASCPEWVEALQEEECNLYRMKKDYTPKAGDLIFFDLNNDESADHVGLVAELTEETETEPAKIRTIEGDSDNCVQSVTRHQDDEKILGYGELPENPELEKPEEAENPEAKEKPEETVSAGETALMTLTFKGEDYEVQVHYTDEAQIPENAKLSVRELTGKEYDKSCRKAKKAMGVDELSFARFFDVSFMVDDKKIEPAAPVDVEITYDKPVEIPAEQVKNAVHFTEEGTELLDTELEQEKNSTTFVFTQDSFSVVGTASGYAAERAATVPTEKSGTQTEQLVVDSWYVLYAMCPDKTYGAKTAYAISTKDPTQVVPLTQASTTGGTVAWNANNEDILWQYTGDGFRNSDGKYLTLRSNGLYQEEIGLGEQSSAVDYSSANHALFNYYWVGAVLRFREVDFQFKNYPYYEISGSFERQLVQPSNPHYIALVSSGGSVDPNPTVTPVPTATPTPIPESVTIPHQKTIDAFRDGEENPDTDLDNQDIDKTDLYRLYLDAVMSPETTPVDLLIVIDQSGSMHMNYGSAADEKKFKDMKDKAGNTIFRDEAVRLVLNGTYSDKDYEEKKNEGLISAFLKMNPENQYAVAEFHGDPPGDNKFHNYTYNVDASPLRDWNHELKYVATNVEKYIKEEKRATNYCAGLLQAEELLDKVKDNGHKKIMLFLSDGVPTVYLTKDNGIYKTSGVGNAETYWGAEPDTYNEMTKTFFNDFNNRHPELTTYTVGISSDVNGDASDMTRNPEVLKHMASEGGGQYFSAVKTEDLEAAIRKIINETDYSNLAIHDTLSEYVDLYTKQPDYKVTMKKTDGTEIVLYENGAVTAGGTGKMKEIIYDETTKKVSAVFEPDYKLEAGCTYTLSFNIKTRNEAYEHHATHEYPHIGDDKTDYGANKTSSNQPGYHSNKVASVEYEMSGLRFEELYDHPVVQVQERDPDEPVISSVSHNKTIDAFRVGENNPDTDLDDKHAGESDLFDLYRLYLDAKFDAEVEPVDLLIVVDQSGSMHMDYQDAATNEQYMDMLDESDKKIYRDDAVKLVLNGTYNKDDYGSKKQNGLIYQFLNMHEKNKVAVVEFHGERSENKQLTYYPYNVDSTTVLPWTHNDQFIEIKGKPANATNYCAGFSQSNDVLNDTEIQNDGNKKLMIFLSDGVPTVYLEKGADGGYQIDGVGNPNNTVNAKLYREKTMEYFNWLQGEHPEVTYHSIGISQDITTENERANSIVLQHIANKGGGTYTGVESTDDLAKAMRKLILNIGYSQLTINDTLSEYVDLYGEQPDYKVTMQKKNEAPIVLYENGAVTTAGKGKLSGVTYDPATKKVSAVFDPEYTMLKGYTYTLSFNVKTTQKAYEHHAENPYPHTGDNNTDYETTDSYMTSSNKPGYHSNEVATVEYKKDGSMISEEYDHPVVQVRDRDLIVKKKWYASDKTEITGTKPGKIRFKLYRNVYQKPDPVKPEIVTVSLHSRYTGRLSTTHDLASYSTEKGASATLTFHFNRNTFDGLTVGGQDVQTSELEKNGNTYTYSFVVSDNVSVYIKYDTMYQGPSSYNMSFVTPPPASTDPVLVESKLYREDPYEIDAEPDPSDPSDERWQTVIKNLPQTGTLNGKDVTYTYCVKEVSVANEAGEWVSLEDAGYNVGYDNNDGITVGTITITNTDTKPPEYELPETGGTGTTPYTIGGLLLTAATLLLLYKNKQRGKEDIASS